MTGGERWTRAYIILQDTDTKQSSVLHMKELYTLLDPNDKSNPLKQPAKQVFDQAFQRQFNSKYIDIFLGQLLVLLYTSQAMIDYTT